MKDTTNSVQSWRPAHSLCEGMFVRIRIRFRMAGIRRPAEPLVMEFDLRYQTHALHQIYINSNNTTSTLFGKNMPSSGGKLCNN